MTWILFKSVYMLKSFIIFSMLLLQANSDNLRATIDALQLSLRFYAENYMHMNIDGIFGLRIIEGQMALIMEQLELSAPTPSQHSFVALPRNNVSYILTSVKSMRRQAMQTARLAQTALQQNDEQYYNLMRPLIHRPWKFAKVFGQAAVDVNLRWHVSSDNNSDSMPEELSDRCMGELMGTLNSGNLCSISSDCIAVMSMLRRTGYHITHQLLYGIIAEQYGCLTVLNVRLAPARTSIEKLRSLFCTNNFYEVSDMVLKTNGRISSDLQDLFMEQEFVCPNLGFTEFFHSDWLQQILSWQKPSGCWGQGEASKKHKVSHLGNLKNTEQPSIDESFQQGAFLQPPAHHTRKLLYEVSLPGDCLSHKTAVAVGSLTQYLRFITLADSVGLDAVQHLNGINYLMNPTEVVRSESLAEAQNIDREDRSELIDPVENSRKDSRNVEEDPRNLEDARNREEEDARNREEEEVEEAVRDYQPRQEDLHDNNAEIEINENVNEDSDRAKNSDDGNRDTINAYDSEDNVILKDRANERGVRVKYRTSNRMMALDALTSSLTSLYVGMMVVTVVVVVLLCRVFRCPFYRRCRLRCL